MKRGATGGGGVPQGTYLLSENPVPGLVSICYLIKANVTTTSRLTCLSQLSSYHPAGAVKHR